MDPDRWREIQQIFDHLVDKTPSHRTDYLDMVCEDDLGLRNEVEKLLSVNDEINQAPWLANTTEGQLPQSIGEYSVVRLLGSGAMGKVYLGTNSRGFQYALKLLPHYLVSDEKALLRFEQEARLLSQLSHPNICSLKEVIWLSERPCLILEYCEGLTLRERLEEEMLAPEQVVNILIQIADALASAHQKSVFHRDIKPGNIILSRDDQVKLIDFGIAKYADTKLTATGMILGSPNFMSPEQWRGQSVDGRTDLWSVGVLMHKMLTGSLPFQGENRQQLAVAVLQSQPRPLLYEQDDAQMKSLAEICARLLRKDPERRTASATELICALNRIKFD